jgi:hypothetical protein
MQKIYLTLMFIYLNLICLPIFAEPTVGEVANNAIAPVSVTSGFMENVSLAVFIGFIAGAIFQFIQRRNNPEIPLSRCVWFLIFGLLAGIFWYAQRFNVSTI